MTPAAPAPARSTSATRPPVAHARRQDIQALRALAVILVVVFHLWPRRLTGGYVGVDVFFVISGFLITSHLVKAPPRGPRDLATFWGRRIRRLLPAAFAVILATALAAWVWLPESQWRSLARDASASAFYVENWNLAGNATDYLAAEGASSPFQHFWSLSVEEQFYILWPILLVLAVGVAATRGRSALRAIGLVVAGVFVASLAASVYLTATDPAAAYFVTHTRMWELALGGLLAVGIVARPAWFAWPTAVRTAVVWAALAAIAWSAFAYTGATAFPGTAALVPTVGAAAFIAARSETGRWSPERLTRSAPVQFLGDVSYSVYLWHWPIIVVLPYATGTALHWPTKLGILAATIPLSWASKKWVEDPPQRWSRLASPSRAVGFAVAGMALVVGLGGAQVAVADHRDQQVETRLADALREHPDCAGAAALSANAECAGGPHGTELIVTSAKAALDRSSLYPDDCFSASPFTDHTTCTYGTQDNPTARIALVGNSHAGHWLPMLQALAEKRGWQITTYLASACLPVDLPEVFKEAGASDGCRAWTRWALDETTAGDYDLVVTSARTSRPIAGVAPKDANAAIRDGYTATLSTWAAAGVPTLVMRDTPSGSASVPDCVDQHLENLSACDGARALNLHPDPLAEAARRLGKPTVKVADLTSHLCSASTCYVTVGGLIAYFDSHHLTETFSRTLAPFVEPSIVGLIRPTAS